MKRLVLALLLRAALLLPNPPKKALVQCGKCPTWNEPDRTRCIGCGANL